MSKTFLNYNKMPINCPEILFTGNIPEPCFVLDERALCRNMDILDNIQQETKAKILLALKGFASWGVFPLLSRKFAGPLWGVCASSIDEARLGKEEFGGEVHAFAPAWTDDEIRELIEIADHIVFNSFAQWHKFKPVIEEANNSMRSKNPVKCGLRINPEHSEGKVPLYDPCAPGSRLGIRKREFQKFTNPMQGVSGLHFHTLCEQGAEELSRTLHSVNKNFSSYLENCQWINMGGGHHITKENYNIELLKQSIKDMEARYNAQIYLEPGEAIALNAGWLTASVLDIVEADIPVSILDISAACHTPDVLEMPYTPDVWYHNQNPIKAGKPGKGAWTCRLGGKSCLAGDVFGEYSFNNKLQPGQRLVFADMAIYSIVKTNTFNGLRLPSIGILKSDNKFKLLKQFEYSDFKNRLS